MLKFWLGIFLVILSCQSVSAIDFNIHDPVVSGLEISLIASISASSNYYLQGTLRSQSSSKYFSETQNNKGDWIDYISSPEKEYISSNFFVTDVKNATWSGMVKLRFKLDDPNYLGPGAYDLKLRRFTGNSNNSAGDSNTLAINLTVPLPTPTPSPSPTPTPTPTSSPTPHPSPSPSPKLSPSPLLSPSPEGEVAGVADIDLSGYGASPSPLPTLQGQSLPAQAGSQGPILNHSRLKTILMIGSGLIILSIAGFFGYRKYYGTIAK